MDLIGNLFKAGLLVFDGFSYFVNLHEPSVILLADRVANGFEACPLVDERRLLLLEKSDAAIEPGDFGRRFLPVLDLPPLAVEVTRVLFCKPVDVLAVLRHTVREPLDFEFEVLLALDKRPALVFLCPHIGPQPLDFRLKRIVSALLRRHFGNASGNIGFEFRDGDGDLAGFGAQRRDFFADRFEFAGIMPDVGLLLLLVTLALVELFIDLDKRFLGFVAVDDADVLVVHHDRMLFFVPLDIGRKLFDQKSPLEKAGVLLFRFTGDHRAVAPADDAVASDEGMGVFVPVPAREQARARRCR